MQVSLPLHNLIALAVTLLAVGGMLALLQIQERVVGRYLAHNLGWRSVLVTGWLGVPVHELGHLFFAGIFAHRIVAWRLFEPDPVSGTLGYVRHAYSRRSLYQVLGNVFIAAGPLVSGGLVLGALLYWMLPAQPLSSLGREALALGSLDDPLLQIRDLGLGLTRMVWEHRTPWLPLQLYLAVCVASHLCPSTADISGSLGALAVLVVVLAVAVGICGWQGIATGGMVAVTLPLLLLLLAAGLFQGLYVALVALGLGLTRR